MLSRLIILAAYLAGAFLFGIALGERGELGFVQQVFAGVIPLAALVLTWLARRGRLNVLLTGAAMLAGLFLGQQVFRNAWVECLDEGINVHKAIVQYRAQRENYPARLEELNGDLPCDCILRDTVLHYLSNDRTFRLWMSNDAEVVTFTASGRSSSRSPTPAPRTP